MKKIFNLSKPAVGLSPMDGVTDRAFREITKLTSNPDLIFTEFTHVRALTEAADKVLVAFDYGEIERPVFAQIYGAEPEYFYHIAKVVCALGFDGVDINMGCPAKTVAASGAGAGLIKTPEKAVEIIYQTQKGVNDWVADGKLTGLRNRSRKAVEAMIMRNAKRITQRVDGKNSTGIHNLIAENRKVIPVSVKTRIGYDTPVTESWVKKLSTASPEWISIHGRTLKQMYTGQADWNELKIAVDSTDIPVMTNGDIKTYEDIEKMIKFTGASGVLVGRATFGNPWFFDPKFENLSQEDLLKTMLRHVELFVEYNPDPRAFVMLRKHMAWYCKGFDGAKEMRNSLVRCSNIDEVRTVVGGRV